ncbi:MAG: HyaD/HybD family hydrogenase maturation endopeptidase [Campylobacterales bacterium]
MKDTILIGVGNILFKDEGIGVFAAKYLEYNYDFAEGLDIIDGATLGFRLMSYFQEYKRVYIIDTISIEDTPGSIYKVPAEELMGLGTYRQTAHEVEIVEMLEICSLLESIAEVTIFGIIPKDIESVEMGLTKELEESFDKLIAEVVKEMENIGFQPSKKDGLSLEEIVTTCYKNEI